MIVFSGVTCYFLLGDLCSFRCRWCLICLVVAGVFLNVFVAAAFFLLVPHVCLLVLSHRRYLCLCLAAGIFLISDAICVFLFVLSQLLYFRVVVAGAFVFSLS